MLFVMSCRKKDSSRHEPCHILITGASSGIGAALARIYARPDVSMSLQGRDKERLNSVAENARRRGAKVYTAILDVTDAARMSKWIQACDGRKPLDLVIANAGISAGTGGGGESREQARAIFNVNVNGVLNTIHPALRRMEARKSGQIAIMSSLAGFLGFPGAPAYCASKAAVRVYGEALRECFAPKGVKINVICPGFVKTPMTEINRFPMPFLISAERAARIIKKGLAEDRARIVFPWRMYALVRAFGALPSAFTGFAAGRLPVKEGF